MSNHLEEIKLRVSIEDLVGSYVQLKKAGRNFRGLCPFHSEKTPSFMVSPEKGIAYCFGCHQGGDIFKFVQLVEKVEFNQAVKILADRAGVKLPTELPKQYNQRLKVIEVNQATSIFYQDQLKGFSEGLDYFLNRGLTHELIDQFQLGYAPDRFNDLKNYLTGKGFQEKELLDAAVVNQRSLADQNTYDRFRNRLIFPICDHQGNIVGFSGRLIAEDVKAPKYLNSPDTPAYNKSFILYGLHLAKPAIKEKDLAIFVEGYMDVIATHQAGTKNTIATCGTAITAQQLKLISRYTKNIAFAFDQDSAGMEATFRAIELAQPLDLNIKVIMVQSGKDPDECIQNNPGEWQRAVDQPLEVMDFYFNYALGRHDPSTIEGKKSIMSLILPLIKTYRSDVERGIYLNRLAVLLRTDVHLLWNDLKKVSLKTSQPSYSQQLNQPIASSSERRVTFSREEYLLGIIMNCPDVYEAVYGDIRWDLMVLNSDLEKFYNLLKTVYTRESRVSVDLIEAELDSSETEKLKIYSILIEESYLDLSDSILHREAEKLVHQINRVNLAEAKKRIQFEIRAADNHDQKKVLLQKLVSLNTPIQS